MSAPAPSGLVVVDKPPVLTSHDVVARVRRLAGTRRVGHAGTLDPMATGVLVLGVDRATRLLGHLALTEKAYAATIRLGITTVTDDAQGEEVARVATTQVTDAAIAAAVNDLTGDIEQVPSSVSAIKVDGRRAYKLVRSGEQVELASRPVTVTAFTIQAVRRAGDRDGTDGIHRSENTGSENTGSENTGSENTGSENTGSDNTGASEMASIDLDVSVLCSTGTYVRALARDLGVALGVGGHLTALRRTRVGPYDLTVARTLDQLEAAFEVIPAAAAARSTFPAWDLDATSADQLGHGIRLPWPDSQPAAGPVAAFGPTGELVALIEQRSGRAKILVGFS